MGARRRISVGISMFMYHVCVTIVFSSQLFDSAINRWGVVSRLGVLYF